MEAKELIDIICPEHERHSCNNEDGTPYNGFFEGPGKEGKPNCARCALLELAQGKPLPEAVDAFVSFGVK